MSRSNRMDVEKNAQWREQEQTQQAMQSVQQSSIKERRTESGQPAQKAVALKYNADKDSAPVVIASGYGPVANKIIDIAEQRGIPVYRDDSVASMLCMLGVGANIPEELYQVVATLYSQILKISAGLQNGESLAEEKTGIKKSGRGIAKVMAELIGQDSKVQSVEEGEEKAE